MALHVALHHETHYTYDQPVQMTPQIIRLKPAPHSRTQILSYALKIEPKAHFINWQQDAFSNYLARIVFQEPVREFKVTVDLVADMAIINPFDFFVEEESKVFPFTYSPALAVDLEPYRKKTAVTPLLAAFLRNIPKKAPNTLDWLVALNQKIYNHLQYVIRLEPGLQSPEQTLKKRSGSCRDSAWLLVQVLRQLGVAARFVSGYSIQLVADQTALDGPSGVPYDVTDLHAWCEAYLPGAGWVGLDTTSGLLTSEGHIPLCASPEASSAAPISGGFFGGKVEVAFHHDMRVSRLYESPRVTKPYTPEQWQAVDALGELVEQRIVAGDIRLTQGGEPTFISIDDRQGDEWNTAAVGPTKQTLANDLILRLRQHFAPEGLLTHGQGKWYPGEVLPRWAYGLYWRKDGQPLLRAKIWQGNRPANPLNGEALLVGIARRLEIEPEFVMPAFENPLHYVQQEGLLPDNVTAEDNQLKDAESRARLRGVFMRGLDTPRGHVLPVQRWQSKTWMSERWRFRDGRLLLIPGDSPVGFRLPLDSLPVVPSVDFPYLNPADPTLPSSLRKPDPRRQPFLNLPQEEQIKIREQQRTPEHLQSQPWKIGSTMATGLVRTALSVEARDGYLYAFMPPLEKADDFCDLLSAIEDAALELDLPVRIEGYPPPQDAGLEVIKVTPDPGVIELNIHPAASWQQLKDNVLGSYELARLSRLDTQKFLIDGRAVGTGGGAHIVMGAAHPTDSPFLRRPDVLGSLIRFWQHHPSLSYFFAGLFIGPTSQHPRIDEARDSVLYEMDIALQQLPPRGQSAPLWLVDRLFRNLLTDLAGNTHRSEICIDKLYSPDSATGRLGLLEFRAFEMPPHAEMNLVQQLLLRALVTHFWEQPYTAPLIRWGSRLHDDFLLPHYLHADLLDVLAYLNQHGFAFDPAWFAPHFEFRFPVHGLRQHQGVQIELRHALEPWPVMGEEPGGGGTSRFVDSSLERLQVRVTGFTPERHAIAVGGKALPLTSTGVAGEYVAGVRYRAWSLASSLHPTIGIHTPLVFDLYDKRHSRAVAGCTYHVMHPASRNYDTFPINSYEAESRRLARFSTDGFSSLPYALQEKTNPFMPHTLDLRW